MNIEIITAKDGTKAEMKKHGRNLYSLTIVSRHTGHNRWGTKSEIDLDVAFFIENGRLPISGEHW